MFRTLLSFTLFALLANASTIDITLSNASQNGSPGDTLAFFGILTNTTGATVYLNSASTTSVSADLNLDVTPFFLNAPLSLLPNEATSSIELFDITIGPAAVLGPYLGNAFSIQGGVDDMSFDPLGDASADVTVGASAVPEPASTLLVAAGLLIAISRRPVPRS